MGREKNEGLQTKPKLLNLCVALTTQNSDWLFHGNLSTSAKNAPAAINTRHNHNLQNIFLSPRRVSPFLAWGDFHAHSRSARYAIPEEKWGLLVVYFWTAGAGHLYQFSCMNEVVLAVDMGSSEQANYAYILLVWKVLKVFKLQCVLIFFNFAYPRLIFYVLNWVCYSTTLPYTFKWIYMFVLRSILRWLWV